MLLCSSFALMGFPLDDVWHRLFGQDVTLWGPTHIMMIAGAVLTIVAIQVLETEGQRAAGLDRRAVRRRAPGSCGMSPILACGGLLIGLSVFQGEFNWGVASSARSGTRCCSPAARRCASSPRACARAAAARSARSSSTS